MGGHGVQPSTGIGQPSVGSEMFDEASERILNDILRRIGIVQHRERQPIHAARVEVEQR
jgi:hypothetical protein